MHPAGAPTPLLTDISLSLPPNQLGLVFGRSGAGKTTLLQLVAGLAQPSSGSISFSGPDGTAAAAGTPTSASEDGALSSEARMAQVGREGTIMPKCPHEALGHALQPSMRSSPWVQWAVSRVFFSMRLPFPACRLASSSSSQSATSSAAQ